MQRLKSWVVVLLLWSFSLNICAESSSATLPQKSYTLQKMLSKTYGAIVGVAIGYAAFFKLIPWMLPKTYKSTSVQSHIIKWIGMLGMSYLVSEWAWYITPEGTIVRAQQCMQKYVDKLSRLSMSDERFYDEIITLFPEVEQPLLAAFRYMNTARAELVYVKNQLENIALQHHGSWHHDVDVLLPKIKQFISIAEKSMGLIILHPTWSELVAHEGSFVRSKKKT